MAKSYPWRNRITGSGEENPEQLLAHPMNYRTHPGNQRDALRGSLNEVGWVQQIIVNTQTGYVLDGHARIEEAISRHEKTVPVLYVDLTPKEELIVLASLDNIAALAERDVDRWEQVHEATMDVEDAGLRAMWDAMSKKLTKTGLTDPDEIPDIRVDPGVKTGDLFAMGDHRLLCGDSTKPEDVARLMDGAIADIIWTDPPYGVGYQSTEKLLTGDKYASHRRKDGKTLSNDDLTAEQTRQLVTESLRLAPLKPGGVFYVCSPSGDLELQFRLALIDAGMPLRQQVVWAKDRFVFGRQDYQWRHETVLYGWKDGAAHYFIDDRTQDTVWEIPRPARSEEHPTMKPVELVVRSLNNSSLPGQVVYEPFDGSGTTIIASEQLGRRCYAIEIDPKYVSVAIERWQNFSGGKAVNLATGEPWAGGGDLLARLEKGT